MLPENLEGIFLEHDLKLGRLLGEGGMGIAYEGMQLTLGRRVCVKFLRSKLVADYKLSSRFFQREIQAMATIESDSIARIYSCGMYLHVCPYIVMELVDERPGFTKQIER